MGSEMAMGSEHGRQGRSKSRITKQLSGGSSSLGGGIVVGIATVVVVGVAGKLLSKFRRLSGSTNSIATPFLTPANSLNGIVNEEKSVLLQMHLDCVPHSPNEAVINRKSALSLCHQDGGSDQNDTGAISDREDNPDLACYGFYTEPSPENILEKTSAPDLHSSCGFITQDCEEGVVFSTASTALSELVDHTVLDHAEHDSPSKHEHLQAGVAGESSRTFEEFSSGSGDTSSDELTPTKLKLRVSWETNSSSGSEGETAQVYPGELLAESELLLPGSTTTEADKQAIERVNHDAPAREPEEEVPGIFPHPYSAPFEEQEEEPKGTRTGRNETEGEQPQQQEAGILGSCESANPEVVGPEIQQEKIEPDASLGVLQMKELIKDVASLLDGTTILPLTANESSTDGGAVKKEDLSQTDAEAEIFELTSILLRNANGSPTEITTANENVDSVQILAQVAEEKEGMQMTVTSSMVLSATSHQDCNIAKIVTTKESAGAVGTHRKTSVVTTTVGLKRELEENRRGKRLSLGALALAIVVALFAVLAWSILTAHDNLSLIPGS